MLSRPTENTALTSQTPDVPPLLQLAMEQQALTGHPVDPDKLVPVARQFRMLEHGYHAMVPLKCCGASCNMADRCQLFKNGFTYMVGEPCPLEQHALASWTARYVETLQIAADNTTEINLAADLAKMDVYQMRIANRLNYEDFVQNQVVGVDKDGVPFYRHELHQGAIWRDMLVRRELKIQEALLATRKALAEAGKDSKSQDMSTQLAALQKMVNLLQNEKTIQMKKANTEPAPSSSPEVSNGSPS